MFFRSSMEQRHAKANQAYLKARSALVDYKAQALSFYQEPIGVFVTALDQMYEEKTVPLKALTKAFAQTEGFITGRISSAAYQRTIREMKRETRPSCEPSRLSQAMETLSWAIWVLSILCLLSGGIFLGLAGIFVSIALYGDAQHNDVRFSDTTDLNDASFDLTAIAEEMEKINRLEYCGVKSAFA